MRRWTISGRARSCGSAPIARGDQPTAAAETAFVRRVAGKLGARVEMRTGDTEGLLEALKADELDLVVGPLSQKSPWAAEVALIKPLTEKGDTPPSPFRRRAGGGECVAEPA